MKNIFQKVKCFVGIHKFSEISTESEAGRITRTTTAYYQCGICKFKKFAKMHIEWITPPESITGMYEITKISEKGEPIVFTRKY